MVTTTGPESESSTSRNLHNGLSVELVTSMGDDLSIVNAARVSLHKVSKLVPIGFTGTNKDDVYGLSNADKGLINYLLKNRHGTPFEMVQFTFRVRCPIFVAREWQRHRIGSFNEMSSRYVEMPLEAYMPLFRDFRSQVGKPGHYVMQSLDHVTAEKVHGVILLAYSQAYDAYRKLLDLGLAKEVARNVLPLAQFTEFIWSVNLRSLFNFLYLRMADTALREIRYCAEMVHDLVIPIVPEAMLAWQNNNRLVP